MSGPLPGLPGREPLIQSMYIFGIKPSTPPSVHDAVRAFAKKVLELEAEPIRVAVEMNAESEPLECFRNVERKIELAGGGRRYGWAIWQHGDSMLEGEFHTVWISPTGQLFDVTPHDEEKEIVFVPDDRIKWTAAIVPNRRRAMNDSPAIRQKVKDFEDMLEMNRAFEAKYVTAVYKPLHRAAIGRNDLCPCGSGKKFKKCCDLIE